MATHTRNLLFVSQLGLLRFVAKILSSLPNKFLDAFKLLVGALMIRFAKKDRRLIESNLMKVYKLPPHSNFTKAFVKQVSQHQAAAMVETLAEAVGSKPRIVIEGLDALSETVDRQLSRNKGLIVITAHLGSWEFVANSVAGVSNRPFYALAKPSKLPAFTSFLNEVRNSMKTKVLWTDRKNLLRDMISVLRRGEVLGFVMDQKPEARRGPVVSFMGQDTEFVSGPARIALRCKTPILAVYAIRTGNWSYRMITERISSDGKSEHELTQAMASSIERAIRSYPDQWLWNYKRWRK